MFPFHTRLACSDILHILLTTRTKDGSRLVLIKFNCHILSQSLNILSALIKKKGSSGIWTRDLSHPKGESYP